MFQIEKNYITLISFRSETLLRIRGHVLELYVPENQYKNIQDRNRINVTELKFKNSSIPSVMIFTTEFPPLQEAYSLQKAVNISSDASLTAQTQNTNNKSKNNTDIDTQTINKSEPSRYPGTKQTPTVKNEGCQRLYL